MFTLEGVGVKGERGLVGVKEGLFVYIGRVGGERGKRSWDFCIHRLSLSFEAKRPTFSQLFVNRIRFYWLVSNILHCVVD